MKILFKVLKYAVVIYLLIFFKNLYSEAYLEHSVITVRSPDVVRIRDIQANTEDYPSFAEQMDFFGPETQQNLKNQLELQQRARQNSATANSYKDSLEQGLSEDQPTEDESHAVNQYTEQNRSNNLSPDNQNSRRQLRGITPGFDSYHNQKNIGQEQTPVPPAIIDID